MLSPAGVTTVISSFFHQNRKRTKITSELKRRRFSEREKKIRIRSKEWIRIAIYEWIIL